MAKVIVGMTTSLDGFVNDRDLVVGEGSVAGFDVVRDAQELRLSTELFEQTARAFVG